MHTPNQQHTLVVGSPGTGKSVAAVQYALDFDGAVVIYDPHRDSMARMFLAGAPLGNVIFDRLSDTKNAPGYGIMVPSKKRGAEGHRENYHATQQFKEVLLRRREMASM